MAQNCHKDNAVAVIGLGCRFPGDASDPESFWEMLCNGRSAYSEINRYNVDAFQSDIEGKLNTSRPRGAHFLRDDVAAFDANFFTINENEASAMDPQARIMLEVAYEAFENAGLPIENVAGTKTSCYVGNFTTDYREMVFRDPDIAPRYSLSGTGQELISNRLSWFYDLRGPSFTLGTACSSSLVALHQGYQSLQNGDADMSIVGGCNLLLNPEMFLVLSNMQFLAQDGRCKTFDAKGDGYGRGEGFGAVVLKRVDDAIRDGDPIRAIVRGTGVNQDGHTKGITVPSADAQANLIHSVYNRAGLSFDQTHYIECHGTGTQTGDPLELEAVSKTLSSCRKAGETVLVGSVKPNIGHLEAAAGLAGLIKAIFILEKGLIPPNLLFEEPNPRINFEAWKLSVPTKATNWPTEGLRRISVQGFGYGGTNAHAVLDDAVHYLTQKESQKDAFARSQAIPQYRGYQTNGISHQDVLEPTVKDIRTHVKEIYKHYSLFILSAHDRNGLQRQRESLAKYLTLLKARHDLAEDQFLRDLAYTLSRKRSRLAWKTHAVASSLDDLMTQLQVPEANMPVSRSATTTPRLGFVFTGQGAQWARMGIELSHYQVFRQSVKESDNYLCSELACPWSAFEELRKDESKSQINNPAFSQPLCTVLQIALVDLLDSWGIVPSAVVGHSSGEIAGAYCLGALTKEDALKAAYYRGLLATRLKEVSPSTRGAMLAVGASEAQAQEWLDNIPPTSGEVVAACINSPSSVTLSGDANLIDELQNDLQQKQIFARKLKVDIAYHSPHLNAISMQYLELLNSVKPQRPHEKRQMYSSVNASAIEASELGAIYWVRNLVSPVLFYDALREMLESPNSVEKSVDCLLEIGPHSTLHGAVNQIMNKHDIRGIPYASMLSRGRNAAETSVAAAASLFANGVPVNVDQLNRGVESENIKIPSPLVDLPPYHWNHSRTFWAESRMFKEYRKRDSPRLSLIGAPAPRMAGDEYLWRGPIRVDEQPWTRDHKIQSSILYPAAGYIAMAIEAAAQISAAGQSIKDFRLKDVHIVAPTVLEEDSELECTIQLRPHRAGNGSNSAPLMRFSISTCRSGEDLRENCFGLIQVQYHSKDNASVCHEDDEEHQAAKALYYKYKRDCNISEDFHALYAEFSAIGLNYGPKFQNMSQVHRQPGKSCFRVTVPNVGALRKSDRFNRPHMIHPTTLDSMFHAVFAAFKGIKGDLTEAMVPTSIGEISVSTDMPFEPGSQSVGFSHAWEHGFHDLMADVVMFSEDLSSSTVVVKGFHCSKVSGAGANNQHSLVQAKGNTFSKMIWKPAADLLTSDEISRFVSQHEPSLSILKEIETCEDLAIQVIAKALKTTQIDDIPDVQLQGVYTWMQDQQKRMQELRNDGLRINDLLHDETESESVEVATMQRFARNIKSILTGKVNVEQVLLEDDLLHRWFAQLQGLEECFRKLSIYIDILAHQQPALSILEIGGVAGDAVSSIIPCDLTKDNPLSFSRYVFSASTEHDLALAKERLVHLKGQVEFKTLAMNRDPKTQGLDENSFDIIVCSSFDVWRNADILLPNALRLLKPGGRVCLAGITNPSLRLLSVLRCLQAYQSDEYAIPEDLVTQQGILERHNLASQFSITDFEDARQGQLSVIVATPTATFQNGITTHEAVIIEALQSTNTTDMLATQLVSELESHSVVPKRKAWEADLSDLGKKDIIFLLAFDNFQLEDLAEQHFTRVKELVNSPAKLIWVTSLSNPAGALVTGMARTIRNEMPGKEFVVVSLQTKTFETSTTLAKQLAYISVNSSNDAELLEEDGLLKVCRVVEDTQLHGEIIKFEEEADDHIEQTPLKDAVSPQVLAFQTQGMLESVCFETDDLATAPLSDDEMEIEVKATGMNFRDVIAALGQIPDNLLGFDASGIVTRVGKEVSSFKVGDEVCTLGHGTYRTHFRNKADFFQTIPEGLSFEEAATLPLVHTTAFHALVNLARVRPKQTILIHAAAGGVGQAAIQLAQHFDLEIYATVGSATKRELLRESYGIPEDHIFNSRDLSFAKGVLRMTGGRGVDCILNSLSGQALQETWRCIAPFGTFVEIGMRDILDNSGLDMRPFMQDSTFSFMNMKHVMVGHPKLMKEILDGTFDLLRRGIIRKVSPVTSYSISCVEDAFRLMQSGKHLGKIAVTWTKSEAVPVLHRPRSSTILSPDGTYVLCGGLGGLGRSLADLLIQMGARHLCFISRSGKKSAAAADLVEKLENQSITTTIYSCDIANEKDLAAALHDCSQNSPPIKGVIQCAMVLRDVSFTSMTHDQWTESLRPKVQGTWNLHTLLPTTLDFFVTLSSFAGIFGNLTQSNYAAAGAFQDALAHYRVAHGHKAVTIDLGVMRDVGVIAESGSIGALKEWEEPFGIREPDFHQLMKMIITKEHASTTASLPPQIITGFATGGAAQAAGITEPFYFADPRFSHLALTGLSSSSTAPTASSAQNPLQNFPQLAGAEPDAATARLTAALVARVARSLQTDASEISDSRPLHSYGVDSLVAIEVANWLFREINVTVTVFEVLANTPLGEFAGKLVQKCRNTHGGGKGAEEGG